MKLKMSLIKGNKKMKMGSVKSTKKDYKTPNAIKNFVKKKWY